MNLRNDKALNSYIEHLICQKGEGVDTFTASDFEDANFIKSNKDKITKAMIYQWMKKHVRDHLANKGDVPFLERVRIARGGDPDWVENALRKGKPVYFFNGAKVPEQFKDDLIHIKDYLGAVAEKYLNEALGNNTPITIDALTDISVADLKNKKIIAHETLEHHEKYKIFDFILNKANDRYEQVTGQTVEREITAEEKKALEQDTEFVADFGDGIKMVRLLTPNALHKENEYMNHGMDGMLYEEFVMKDMSRIYSIRDKYGVPHVTFEVKDGKDIRCCRGKNGRIVTDNYIFYMRKFMTEHKLDISRDAQNIRLCKDIDGKLHDIYNIPEGTVFEDLDLSGMNFTELPASLANCTVKGRLICNSCIYLKSLKNLPKGVTEIDCSYCTDLNTLEGCSDSVETIVCRGCTSLPSLKGCGKNVKRIDVSYSTSFTSFEGCPEGVKEINCNGCTALPSLKTCPRNVEILNISRCTSLPSLEDCPPNLKELYCYGCSFTSLKGCPENLEKLNIINCRSLTSLIGLPRSIKKVDCSWCTSLPSLEGLHDEVEEINCWDCTGLTTLEGCPANVKRIDCTGCINLRYIPDYISDDVIFGLTKRKIAQLRANWRAENAPVMDKHTKIVKDIQGNVHDLRNIPEGTVFDTLDLSNMEIAELPASLANCKARKIIVNGCDNFSSFKNLPQGLEIVYCESCNSLGTLEGLPKDLKELYCSGCQDLYSLKGCPPNLKVFKCFNCPKLRSLEGCPEGLEELNISGCESLLTLKGCPKSLKTLFCMDCTRLQFLTGLHEGLEHLCVRGCTSLKSLEGCPESVKQIDCTNCTSLESLEGCPNNIKEINCEGCTNLKYIPDYIPDEAIKGISKEKIAECKANWQEKNAPTIGNKCSRYCISLKDIQNIPAGTVFKELDLSGLNVTELPEVLATCTVETFVIRNCKKLDSLKNCPQGVESLDCSYSSIKTLKGCPESVKYLDCDSTDISSFEGCPESVEYLNCSNTYISSLEGCPKNVETLNCSLTEITTLKGCPESVKYLDCCNTPVTTLEGCPKDIKDIKCYGCFNLKYIPTYIPTEAIKGLTKGEIAKCKLNWVLKQNKEAFKAKLNAISSAFTREH